MTTEREFNRNHATPSVVPVDDDDIAPNRATKSSRLASPASPELSGLVMRKARDANGVAAGADHLVAAASSSAGSALPMSLMRKFESALGTDLSSVRVHTDAASATAADAVGARAYTIGQDIHFSAGEYDPSSGNGEHLLAHEVAHTVQQRGGTPTRQNKLDVSSPHDAAEHEADRAADAMISGQSFAVTMGGGAQRKVFRDTDPAAAPVDLKTWIDLPSTKLATWKFAYATVDVQFKGKIGIQLSNTDGGGNPATSPITGGVVASDKGFGVKAELELAKQRFLYSLFKLNAPKVKEKVSFELSANQFNVAIGAEGRCVWEKLPWLAGALDLSFIFAGVKWSDLVENPDAIKVFAGEGAIGIAGEGKNGGETITTAAQLVCTASPNWPRILGEAAKQGARTGATATGATTATTTATATAAGGEAALAAGVVETSAVVSAAAGVILPLGVAAVMVLGGMQTEKNIVASRAAYAAGGKMRGEIDRYVSGYLNALAGRNATGAGAAEANEKVLAYMSATGKSREQAGADLMAHNGGSSKLKTELTTQMRARLYTDAVEWFEAKFADQFGLLEEWGGEDWGMRGVFRKDLKRFLYGNS